MTGAELVTLEAAGPSDEALLANLLELYIHDLSAAFPDLEPGPDGRFGYPRLAAYWAEPNRRFAFLIRAAGRVIGFALVTRGSSAVPDPEVFDLAEFFVLRRHRRRGMGRAAARLLWNRLPGRWIVRAAATNPGAVAFWRAVITEFAGRVSESARADQPPGWTVFAFSSAGDLALRGLALAASLTVKDLGASEAWYRDVVGFEVDRRFERESRLVAVSIRAGEVRVLLTEDDGSKGGDRRKGEGFSLQITTAQDIDALAARITHRGGCLESPPVETPWGVRMFRMRDLDGFRWTVSSTQTNQERNG